MVLALTTKTRYGPKSNPKTKRLDICSENMGIDDEPCQRVCWWWWKSLYCRELAASHLQTVGFLHMPILLLVACYEESVANRFPNLDAWHWYAQSILCKHSCCQCRRSKCKQLSSLIPVQGAASVCRGDQPIGLPNRRGVFGHLDHRQPLWRPDVRTRKTSRLICRKQVRR